METVHESSWHIADTSAQRKALFRWIRGSWLSLSLQRGGFVAWTHQHGACASPNGVAARHATP
jgi:hypothetical protein